MDCLYTILHLVFCAAAAPRGGRGGTDRARGPERRERRGERCLTASHQSSRDKTTPASPTRAHTAHPYPPHRHSVCITHTHTHTQSTSHTHTCTHRGDTPRVAVGLYHKRTPHPMAPTEGSTIEAPRRFGAHHCDRPIPTTRLSHMNTQLTSLPDVTHIHHSASSTHRCQAYRGGSPHLRVGGNIVPPPLPLPPSPVPTATDFGTHGSKPAFDPSALVCLHMQEPHPHSPPRAVSRFSPLSHASHHLQHARNTRARPPRLSPPAPPLDPRRFGSHALVAAAAAAT